MRFSWTIGALAECNIEWILAEDLMISTAAMQGSVDFFAKLCPRMSSPLTPSLGIAESHSMHSLFISL